MNTRLNWLAVFAAIFGIYSMIAAIGKLIIFSIEPVWVAFLVGGAFILLPEVFAAVGLFLAPRKDAWVFEAMMLGEIAGFLVTIFALSMMFSVIVMIMGIAIAVILFIVDTVKNM